MYKDLTSAEVIADSTWDGVRLTTFRATLPTIVQFHLLRHRAFSFSFASMRAIPMKRQIELVKESPFFPQQWPKNQAGMSAAENLEDGYYAELVWASAAENAIYNAQRLTTAGVHKEIASRLLLPFSWTTCIISTTMPGLDNFFAQRDHEDAQPEMQTLAKAMRKALDESTPLKRTAHVPFDSGYGTRLESAMIRSVAHCARVSYGRELEEKTYEEDVALVERLIRSGHWSPLEHVGIAKDMHPFVPKRQFPPSFECVKCLRDKAFHEPYGASGTLGNFEYPWSQLRHCWREYLPSIAARLE